MLTKYTLTIGSTEYDIPDECLKNWDEISFSLKRTDYSGVMRSFSTEFQFVGAIKTLLWNLYLDDGFHAEAKVAVYTITNRHEWVKQFDEALDFSTLEVEEGVLSINALDNTLAALIKAKKGQKYEYQVSTFLSDSVSVYITRMELKSYAYWRFPLSENTPGSNEDKSVCLHLVNNKSAVISKAYLEPYDESNGDDGFAENSFFILSHEYGASLSLEIKGTVRCWLDRDKYGESRNGSVHSSEMQLWTLVESEQGTNTRTRLATLWNDDVSHITIEGTTYSQLYGGSLDIVEASAASLPAGTRVGQFAIIGNNSDPTTSGYWENNHVYEWNGTAWVDKGVCENYKQDRLIDFTYVLPESSPYPLVMRDTHIELSLTGKMFLDISSKDFYIKADWSDPVENAFGVTGIPPAVLATRLVQSIAPAATVTIDADSDGLIATTALVAGESLRRIGDAKIYSTFQEFCNFMECVFGYTYAIEGNNVHFMHRSAVFPDTVSKEIDSFNEFSYEVNDNIIYTEVDVGFAKKDYSEIDGRYEKNFMNYYATGFDLTDKKYTLTTKYRADSYGIEFTARKSNSETTDDKADEDVFFVHYEVQQGANPIYEPDDNDDYNPSLCMERNAAYLAAMGNGDAVTFDMTSSDGNNSLTDVDVDAGDNLFTAGEIEFTTDDMEMPSNVNALVQLDHNGFRYTGFIQEAECRYGKRNGVKYNLIVKEITELT